MHKHEYDLNIEWGEGANMIMCYKICDRDCSCRLLTLCVNIFWPMFLNFMLVSSLGNLLVGEIANLLKLNDMKHLLIRLFKGNCLD